MAERWGWLSSALVLALLATACSNGGLDGLLGGDGDLDPEPDMGSGMACVGDRSISATEENTCQGDEICVSSTCGPAFGRTYRVRLVGTVEMVCVNCILGLRIDEEDVLAADFSSGSGFDDGEVTEAEVTIEADSVLEARAYDEDDGTYVAQCEGTISAEALRGVYVNCDGEDPTGMGRYVGHMQWAAEPL